MVKTQLFRRLSVREMYSRTGALFWNHSVFFILLGAIDYIAALLMTMQQPSANMTDGANSSSSSSGSSELPDDNSNDDFSERGGLSVAFLFILHILFMLVNFTVAAAMARGVSEIYMGKTPGLRECLRHGLGVCCSLLGAVYLVSFIIGICGGLVLVVVLSFSDAATYVLVPLLVCGVVLLCIYLTFFTSTAVIEKKGPIGIIKRSFELARSQDFFFILVTGVTSTLACVIFGSLLSFSVIGGVTGFILNVLKSLVFVPLAAIMNTLVYLNIRIEREGLNASVLAGDLGYVVAQGPPLVADLSSSSPGYVAVSLDPNDSKDDDSNVPGP